MEIQPMDPSNHLRTPALLLQTGVSHTRNFYWNNWTDVRIQPNVFFADDDVRPGDRHVKKGFTAQWDADSWGRWGWNADFVQSHDQERLHLKESWKPIHGIQFQKQKIHVRTRSWANPGYSHSGRYLDLGFYHYTIWIADLVIFLIKKNLTYWY